MTPQMVADERQGIHEGWLGFVVPGGSTTRERRPSAEEVIGEERHEGEQTEECWGGAGNCSVGPLPLRLDPKMSADLAEGDLELPAQREPADDLQRISG